jgi:secondary thiamine-phosphate synthase enzyme
MYRERIRLQPYRRGFHLITGIVEGVVERSGCKEGLVHLFLKHTSASLTINENVDPSVRSDMEHFFRDICDDKAYFVHTYEGSDDMPAHLKASLIGNALTIPLSGGRLEMGIWQGIYLGEHRDHAGGREIVVSIMT